MKKWIITVSIIAVGAFLFAIIPPQVSKAQSDKKETPSLSPEVKILQQEADSKMKMIKRLAAKEPPAPETRVVYRTKYVRTAPKEITVYTRMNGEVTEHKVKNDNGFYVLDLKPETETNVVTETYYIDTCIHDKKRTIWRQMFGK